MATPLLSRATAEERLIWFGLVLTYPCFLVGGVYVLGSVLAWLILAVLLLRWYVEGREASAIIPLLVWLWVVAMGVMLVALIVAHVDRQLGLAQTIKSSIGWAKGWALLALFPLLGAAVQFKAELLIRGCCVIAAHSLLFAGVSMLVFLAGLSGELFISPLKVIGGPGEDFFAVSFFALNPETGLPRWRFFGPWAPSAGLFACIYLVICSQERDRFWRACGVMGALVMCLLCQSRAGWAIFIVLVPLLILIDRFQNPLVLMLAGVLFVAVLLLGQPLFEWVMESYQQIKDSRPDSTRVRTALAEIALQRWQSEAPIWGHGIVERGPKLVEYMPIGSHHSWYGLLFVKGWVGVLSLSIPLLMTIAYLAVDGWNNKQSLVALLLVLVLVGYSFFENLEILVYLFWPALMWLGMALNPLKLEGVTHE